MTEGRAEMRLARHFLLRAWVGYALVWVAFLTVPYWPWLPKETSLGFGMIVILGFAIGLVVTLAALLVGVAMGWTALRQRENRTWPNFVLVGLSIVGAAAQAFFVSIFVLGAI